MLQFVNGLPEKLAFFVRSGHPKTLEDAFQAAKMGEAYGYRAGAEAVGTVSAAQIPRGSLEAKVDFLAEQVSQLLKCGSGNKQIPNNFTCFTCGGENHSQRACNWVKGDPNPLTQCQLCEQFGHAAQGCRRFNDQGNGYHPRSIGRGRFGAGRRHRGPEVGHQ